MTKHSKKKTQLELTKPREKNGKYWVVSFIILVIGYRSVCSLYCASEPLQFETIFSYLVPLVPLHLAIYLIHIRKANWDLKIFNKFFARVNIKTKAGVSALVIPIIICISPDNNLFNFIEQAIAAVVAVMLFDWLKIHRNTVEDEEVVNRAKHHIAPGLAKAYFSYIENVVKGVYDEDGNEVSEPHEDALRDYVKENEIGTARDMVSEKILILFPESDKIRGTVHEIAAREKASGENYSLTLEPIIHRYMASGQPRKSVLNVIKVQDNEIKTRYICKENCSEISYLRSKSVGADRAVTNLMHKRESLLEDKIQGCGKFHEKKDWQNNYVIFCENRPLNTLYQMVDAPDHQICFERKDFEIQFNLYYRELKRLIEEDEMCKNKVELFLYSDYHNCKDGNFSTNLKAKVKEMKMK